MKKIGVSLLLNMFIVILVTIGFTFMFIGFKFMPGDTLLETTRLEVFKFYTVDSNILIGIISLILVIYEIKLLNGYIDKIPNFIYILKLIGTAGITLTFATTAIFLVPQYGFYAMYNNNNLFFHLIVPLLSIISYVFYEKHDNKYRYALYGIIPMFIYSLYYIPSVFMHLDNITKYDFYGFLQGNINNVYVVIPTIYLITYLMSLLLVYLNRRT